MPTPPNETDPAAWHRHFAMECDNRAHAASVAGRESEHRQAHADAVRALAAIADPEDRAVVQKTFDLVPVP